jgi:hypothetical protein
VRRVIGGPAAEALDPQISRAETQVKADRETLEGLRRGISDAGQTLRAAVERLKLSAG